MLLRFATERATIPSSTWTPDRTNQINIWLSREHPLANPLHPSVHCRRGLAPLAVCSVAFRAGAQHPPPRATGHLKPHRCICLGRCLDFRHRGCRVHRRGGAQAWNAPAVDTVVLPDGRPFAGCATFPFLEGAASCSGKGLRLLFAEADTTGFAWAALPFSPSPDAGAAAMQI